MTETKKYLLLATVPIFMAGLCLGFLIANPSIYWLLAVVVILLIAIDTAKDALGVMALENDVEKLEAVAKEQQRRRITRDPA